MYPADIVRLDSAYCSHAERDWWLSALESCGRDIFTREKQGYNDKCLYKHVLNWFLQKNIQVAHLDLPIGTGRLYGELLPRIGTTVLSIDVYTLDCTFEVPEVLDATIENIADQCRKLQWLQLTKYHQLSNANIADLARCTTLQHLALGGVRRTKSNNESEYELNHLGLTQLRYLQLSRDLCGKWGVKMIASNPHLEFVIIPVASAAIIRAVADNCPKLRKLHLKSSEDGKSKINPAASDSLHTSSCSCLRPLYLKQSLLPSQLRSLRCSQFSNTGVIRVAAGCRNLTLLDLTWRGCFEIDGNLVTQVFASPIDDDAAAAIAKYCTQLTHLDIHACGKITPVGLDAISSSCRNLQRVTVNNEQQDSAIINLAQNCGASLTHLDLGLCWFLSGAAVTAVAVHCKALTKLNLNKSSAATNAALTTVAHHCGASLTSLNVLECNNVSDRGIRAIAQHCPHLR